MIDIQYEFERLGEFDSHVPKLLKCPDSSRLVMSVKLMIQWPFFTNENSEVKGRIQIMS